MLPSELAEQRRHFSPGLPAGPRLPRDPRATAGCPIPTAQLTVESRGWPPGRAERGSLAQPSWSEQAEVGPRPAPHWPPGEPSDLRNCFSTRTPASEATWQLLWPTPLPGGAPRWARPQGRAVEGRDLGTDKGGLQLFRWHCSPSQKTQLPGHCPCSSVSRGFLTALPPSQAGAMGDSWGWGGAGVLLALQRCVLLWGVPTSRTGDRLSPPALAVPH